MCLWLRFAWFAKRKCRGLAAKCTLSPCANASSHLDERLLVSSAGENPPLPTMAHARWGRVLRLFEDSRLAWLSSHALSLYGANHR